MRFLCMHGQGTGSTIFEAQTAALRYQLGAEHEFHFIEGTIPTDPAPEIMAMGRRDEQYLSWIDLQDPRCGEIARQGLEELDEYIASEGPFDAVLAFSQGAAVASTYMLYKARQNPSQQLFEPVFRFAVFLSGLPPGDLDALDRGEWCPLKLDANASIAVPTVNAWGSRDKVYANGCSILSTLCDKSCREVVIHNGAHELPEGNELKQVVTSIRKTIQRVMLRQ